MNELPQGMNLSHPCCLLMGPVRAHRVKLLFETVSFQVSARAGRGGVEVLPWGEWVGHTLQLCSVHSILVISE